VERGAILFRLYEAWFYHAIVRAVACRTAGSSTPFVAYGASLRSG